MQHYDINNNVVLRKDMETDRAMIAKKLKAAREAVGLNQTQLASLLGVARNTYAVWESPNSLRPAPREKKLYEIAFAYGLDGDVFSNWEITPKQVEGLVRAAMHDETKSSAAIYEALAKSQLEEKGKVSFLTGQNYQANAAARLVTVSAENVTAPQQARGGLAAISPPVPGYGFVSEPIESGGLGALLSGMPNKSSDRRPNLGAVVNSFFAAARYQLTQVDESGLALDGYFDRSIEWQATPKKSGASRRGVPTDFYFPGLGNNGGVLAEFVLGRVPYPGCPDYLNSAQLDSKLGHLLKLEKMIGRKVGCKMLVVFDIEELMKKRPEFSMSTFESESSLQYGVDDRLEDLIEVGEVCGIDVHAVSRPEQVAELLFKACTNPT